MPGTVFPMFSCITLLWVFTALKALSKSHHISRMLQHCVMNMSIFGSGADVVITMSDDSAHPWGTGGALAVVVLSMSDVLPVGTGLILLVPPVITDVLVDVVSICGVISSAF